MPDTIQKVPSGALETGAGLSPLSPAESERLVEVRKDALSPNTQRAYKSDYEEFKKWFSGKGYEGVSLPLHPDIVSLYVTEVAGRLKMSTVERHLAALTWMHRTRGFKVDYSIGSVATTMQSLRRTHRSKTNQKAPVDGKVLRAMLATLTGSPMEKLRARAVLLLGFAGAFRRAALCALEVSDLTFYEDHMDVLIRRDKQDQEGRGRVVGVVRGSEGLCPIHAVQKWMAVAGIMDGPVFRAFKRDGAVRAKQLSPQVVALIVKQAVADAKLDPSKFSGHSLRAGHVTEAARRGARLDEIMEVTGHHSTDMVMRYVRAANTVKGTSATKVGLGGPDQVPTGKNCADCGRALVLGKECCR